MKRGIKTNSQIIFALFFICLFGWLDRSVGECVGDWLGGWVNRWLGGWVSDWVGLLVCFIPFCFIFRLCTCDSVTRIHIQGESFTVS